MNNSYGAPAFPQPIHHADLEVFANSGMSLRDYFAAKAMASLIGKCDVGMQRLTAQAAYQIADFMLAERGK